MVKILELLKGLFSQEKEPEQEKVSISELEDWFNNKIEKIGFDSDAQEFLSEVKKIKEQLPEKIENLRTANISKENKNVQDRVKNVVEGHRDNYAREVEQFLENFPKLEKEQFKTIDDYQKVIDYNKEIDQKIDDLAKRTAKSYQASQHLFFKQVEEIFNCLGKLNKLVKEFKKKNKEFSIEKLVLIKEGIKELNDTIEKKEMFQSEILIREKDKKQFESHIKEKEEKLKELKESKEYQNYQELEEEKSKIEKEIKDNDHLVFSYFSKLNKALRRYERLALDNKWITNYLEDNLKAFRKDSNLEIKNSLQGLKKNLLEGKLNFEDKQNNNFLELIERSETGYLEQLSNKSKELTERKENIIEKINNNLITNQINEIHEGQDRLSRKKISVQDNINSIKSKLERIDLEKIKEEIKEKVKKCLKIEITITSFSSP